MEIWDMRETKKRMFSPGIFLNKSINNEFLTLWVDLDTMSTHAKTMN